MNYSKIYYIKEDGVLFRFVWNYIIVEEDRIIEGIYANIKMFKDTYNTELSVSTLKSI